MKKFIAIAALAAILLAAGRADAFVGRPPTISTASVKVVNQSDHAIEVSFNGGAPLAVEPGGNVVKFFLPSLGTVTVHAHVLGSPTVGDTKKAQLLVGRTTLVNATTNASATSLTLTALKPGAVAANSHRETGVLLASGGGLMPLLCLGILLGRRPARRPSQPEQV